VNLLCKVLGVNENKGLSHFTALKHLFDKIELLLWLALHNILLDVVQLQFFRLYFNLLRLFHNLRDSFLYFLVNLLCAFGVSSGEQDPLHFIVLRTLLDVLIARNFLESLKILVIQEKHVCFINNQTP